MLRDSRRGPRGPSRDPQRFELPRCPSGYARGEPVKILALSDAVVPFIYSLDLKTHLPDVDMVVSCGDLPAKYLEFVITLLNVPLLYVPGNHDADHFSVPGGIAIDGRLIFIEGVRVLGIGGSQRYKPRGRHQYTDPEMALRILPKYPGLIVNRLRFGQGIDLLVTHAPPLGIHDGRDLAHTGFRSFRRLMDLARPRMLVHGHIHARRNLEPTVSRYQDTMVCNIYPYRILHRAPDGAWDVGGQETA